jgi:hypothetical protein
MGLRCAIASQTNGLGAGSAATAAELNMTCRTGQIMLTDVRPLPATHFKTPHNQTFSNRLLTIWGWFCERCEIGVDFTVAKLLSLSSASTAYTYLPPTIMISDEKDKVKPIWTDTLNGVEVSVYRNIVKGRKLPVYKISRKKWFKSEDKLKSNYTLDRGDWAIAKSLECDAWRDIAKLARAERAELKTAKTAAADSSSDDGTEPVIE